MEEETNPNGEFHHFQLVNTDGEIPVSISVLVHYNKNKGPFNQDVPPIETNEIIALHDALEHFDGDYRKAFKTK